MLPRYRQRIAGRWEFWGFGPWDDESHWKSPVTQKGFPSYQSLGVKDINGAEIFIGDVVRAKTKDATRGWVQGVLILEDFEVCIETHDPLWPMVSLLIVDAHTLQVIGNVEDNPELLEDEEG